MLKVIPEIIPVHIWSTVNEFADLTSIIEDNTWQRENSVASLCQTVSTPTTH